MEETKKIAVESYIRETIAVYNNTYKGLIPENLIENGIKFYTSDKYKDMPLEEIIAEINKMINQTIKDMLKKLIDGLVGNAITPEQKEQKVTEYMQSQNSLDMASFIYNDFTKNFSNQEQINKLFEELGKHFSFSSEEIIANAQRIKDGNVKVGQMSIDENHQLIKNTLPILNLLVENNVDFYLVGALPAYMVTGAEDTRYHDDIDLLLNEEDIPKVKKIVEMYGFTFEDKRHDSPKYFDQEQNRPRGEHELLAQHNTSEFHIGFFCFERSKDGAVIHKDYFKDEEGNTLVYKYNISKEQSDIEYDDTVHEYEDFRFKMASLESIYRIKKYTQREKDIIDTQMIEASGKLNPEIMAKLDACERMENTIEAVQKDPSEPIIIEETLPEDEEERIATPESSMGDELASMLETPTETEDEKSADNTMEKPKVKQLTTQAGPSADTTSQAPSESGYTTASILIVILVIIALLTVGTLIYLLV